MTRAELAAAGHPVDEATFERLSRFLALLLEENQKLNLTSIRDPAQAWIAHVADSLALRPLIDAHRPRSLLDLGAGGGVPGIVIACVYPELPITLLDATQKKLAAAERIVAALALANVSTTWGRAEQLARSAEYRGRFDAVTARAVAALPSLVGYAAGFLRPGGWAWLFKTQTACTAELGQAAGPARRAGLERAAIHRYDLPGVRVPRVIVAYRKRSHSAGGKA